MYAYKIKKTCIDKMRRDAISKGIRFEEAADIVMGFARGRIDEGGNERIESTITLGEYESEYDARAAFDEMEKSFTPELRFYRENGIAYVSAKMYYIEEIDLDEPEELQEFYSLVIDLYAASTNDIED